MKADETKNFKSLEKLIEDCTEEKDTLFAIYGWGDTKDGCSLFVGDEKYIADAMIAILWDALSIKSSEGSLKIANAFLNAIRGILETPTVQADLLIDVLARVVEEAGEIRFKNEKENNNSFEGKFNPCCNTCLLCDDYGKCLSDVSFGNNDNSCGLDMEIMENGERREIKCHHCKKMN